MANSRGSQTLLPEMSETTPLNRDEHKHNVADEDYAGTATFCVCGCFHKFCAFRWRRDSEGHSGRNGNLQEEKRESWARKKAKELKEISEKIAGPKWKNFTRRFSNTFNNKKIRRNLDFQYDLRSYSLNFDDGERFSGDFPARFGAPVVKNGTELRGSDSSL